MRRRSPARMPSPKPKLLVKYTLPVRNEDEEEEEWQRIKMLSWDGKSRVKKVKSPRRESSEDVDESEPEYMSKLHVVRVGKGEMFSIILSGCYSCGYSWVLKYDEDVFEMVGKETVCPRNARDAPGTNCVQKKMFIVRDRVKRGTYNMMGHNIRTWERSSEEHPTKWIVDYTGK